MLPIRGGRRTRDPVAGAVGALWRRCCNEVLRSSWCDEPPARPRPRCRPEPRPRTRSWPWPYRIRTGWKIGSAALVADGLHARTDGFTSLAVLLGAGGVALGWDWADPAVGLLITVAILAVLRQAAREIWRRLMDAVDPALVDEAESILRATPGVLGVGQVRLRWIGHQIRAECEIVVHPDISAAQAHEVTVSAEHALLHAIPRLSAGLVHADPAAAGADPHGVLADHRPVPVPGRP
jgi:divalent metal cation (Fe/Co/Zn/Cd) transporter